MSITIQDKIQQFSKRIFANIEAQSEVRKQELTKQYKTEIEMRTSEVAAKKKEILDSAMAKAERERVRIIAQAQSNENHMLTTKKQQFLQEVIKKLYGHAVAFANSEEYHSYMTANIRTVLQSLSKSHKISIYVMEKDMALCSEILEREGKDLMSNSSCQVLKATRDIIGGLIAEDIDNLIQLDFTLRALIDDNKDLVGAAITRKFNEVSSL